MKHLALITILAAVWISLAAQGLNRPESVAFDPGSGYFFVSNTGNGSIVMTKDLKTYSYLTQNKGRVRGLFISGRNLYAASDKGLLVFDLDGQTLLQTVPVPGSSFLNDVVADGEGNIYITDNQAHKIFKYVPDSGVVSTSVGKGIQGPNGIIYDAKKNRLLFVSLRPKSPIQAISLPGGAVTTFKATQNGNLDGLGMDKAGNMYFSSWETSSVYRLKDQNSAPVRIVKNLSGPADFFVFEYEGTLSLLIPELTGSRLKVVEVTP